jgi:hypothetical protein
MRRLALGLSLLALCAALGLPALAQPMSDVFDRGNEAYFVGDYDDAIAAYQELVEAGVDDPDLEYDLGTAWAQKGQLGRAMVHFERALWLRPGDEEARASLDAATETLIERRVAREGEAELATSRSFVDALLRSVSEDGLAYALAGFHLLFFALVAALLATEREQVRLALRVVTPLVGAVAVLLGLGLVLKAGVIGRTGEAAIVVADQVVLREGPTDAATERGTLREGDRVDIVGSHEDFLRVRTEGGREGWASEGAIEPVLAPWRTAEHIAH